jgi:hypothetical protein
VRRTPLPSSPRALLAGAAPACAAPHAPARGPHGREPCARRRYYYDYNMGLQAQSSLYSMATVDDIDNATLVFDPNTLSKDGTVAVNNYAFSWNGDLIAYNVARCDTTPAAGVRGRAAAPHLRIASAAVLRTCCNALRGGLSVKRRSWACAQRGLGLGDDQADAHR